MEKQEEAGLRKKPTVSSDFYMKRATFQEYLQCLNTDAVRVGLCPHCAECLFRIVFDRNVICVKCDFAPYLLLLMPSHF